MANIMETVSKIIGSWVCGNQYLASTVVMLPTNQLRAFLVQPQFVIGLYINFILSAKLSTWSPTGW